ncbi:hypothetical protein JST56_01080 [Candidatus Dependentiae bacterium]|jgi:hypothetical protein|nr:hypothetical protein [Candidatus Dependentiae bacterium]
MKKMFTLAFILALAAVCPVVADVTDVQTTESDLEALMAELNAPAQEETIVTPEIEVPVADVTTDVQEEK